MSCCHTEALSRGSHVFNMACGYSILLLSIPITPLIQLPTDPTPLLSPMAMPTNWTRVEFKGQFPHSVELVGGWALDDLVRAEHASEILHCLNSSDYHEENHGIGCECLTFKAWVCFFVCRYVAWLLKLLVSLRSPSNMVKLFGRAPMSSRSVLKILWSPSKPSDLRMQWVCPTCRAMVQRKWRSGHLKTHIKKSPEATSLLTEALGSDQESPGAQNSNPLPISCHPAKLVNQDPPTIPSVPSPAQPSQPLRTVPSPVHIPEVTVSPSPSTLEPRSLSWVTRHPPSPIQQSHSLNDSEPPYQRLLGMPSMGLHPYQYSPSFS